MALAKSLDENHMVDLIAALLHDVYESYPLYPVLYWKHPGSNSSCPSRLWPRVGSHEHQAVETNYADLRKTIKLVKRRVREEGTSFLTKTLPALGKAVDYALSHDTPFDCHSCRFQPAEKGGKLPLFLGRLFRMVFQESGEVLPDPDAQAVKVIRQICYLYYKYELPYTPEQEREVIQKFRQTEDDLVDHIKNIEEIRQELDEMPPTVRRHKSFELVHVVREARIRLSNLLSGFDCTDICPRHGPGAVATKQKLWGKYYWTNVCERIVAQYPMDAYFFASLGHVADRPEILNRITTRDLPAQVILVNKDSRGPRLISCEPVDFQWIQSGFADALVEWVESHPLTKGVVNFTTQDYNRDRALFGSCDGHYATLDLAEASDRVSLELVRLLFPSHFTKYLEACRSQATKLPSGEQLELRKFAPMGSGLCFPILALTIWALVTAAVPDCRSSKDLLVYGDDVIVPRTKVRDTIEILEAFGLSINRSKSATSGFFRESCGMDAFYGVDVTPVRLRTVWSSSRSPGLYSSWIAYANSFWGLGYYRTYWHIVDGLLKRFGSIPDKSIVSDDSAPALPLVPESYLPRRKRWNADLQKVEHFINVVEPVKVDHTMDGWSMLLRYFCESRSRGRMDFRLDRVTWGDVFAVFFSQHCAPFSVRSYTHQRMSKLVRRWR